MICDVIFLHTTVCNHNHRSKQHGWIAVSLILFIFYTRLFCITNYTCIFLSSLNSWTDIWLGWLTYCINFFHITVYKCFVHITNITEHNLLKFYFFLLSLLCTPQTAVSSILASNIIEQRLSKDSSVRLIFLVSQTEMFSHVCDKYLNAIFICVIHLRSHCNLFCS